MRKLWNVLKLILLFIGLFFMLASAGIRFLGMLCYEVGMGNSVYELIKSYVSIIPIRKGSFS